MTISWWESFCEPFSRRSDLWHKQAPVSKMKEETNKLKKNQNAMPGQIVCSWERKGQQGVCACRSDRGWALMKVRAWQAGSQRDVFPLQIHCKCHLFIVWSQAKHAHAYWDKVSAWPITAATTTYLLSHTLHLVLLKNLLRLFRFSVQPPLKLLCYDGKWLLYSRSPHTELAVCGLSAFPFFFFFHSIFRHRPLLVVPRWALQT